MSQTGRFRVSCFLLFGGLVLLAPQLRAQSDPMTKWKPNVGDRFTYHFTQNCPFYPDDCFHWCNPRNDTVVITITAVNAYLDSIRQSVVLAQSSNSDYFWFYTDPNAAGSNSPIIVETDEHWTYLCSQGFKLKLADAVDTEIEFNSRKWHGRSQGGWIYLPELRWFYSATGGCIYTEGLGCFAPWGATLIEAQLSSSGVSLLGVDGLTFEIRPQAGGFLSLSFNAHIDGPIDIELIDILGRNVLRQHFSSKDESLLLNVADVPSGIYFLKLSAPGVQEVRRVCIAH